MNLFHIFAKHGLRVFSFSDVAELLKEESFSASYIRKLLTVMAKRGDLQRLGNGLYALPVHILSGGSLHAFEIAMKLVHRGAISHRSAMFHHGITDQILTHVYITSPRVPESNRSSKSAYLINDTHYNIRRVQADHYYGVKRIFMGEISFWITDLEKTMIDGLSDPNLCGGFREVLHAFSHARDNVNSETLLDYLKREPTVIAKRVGWILETIKMLPELQSELEKMPTQVVQKLDPSGLRRGHINKRWMLLENM
ncbi:MAG: hypothetical protein NWQ29_03875 [Alphaproteobacteria bacterium]|nr:hypothetical protein [Alphaproteobacteria bacterium]